MPATAVSSGRKDADAPGLTANFGTWSVNEADKTLTLHRVGAREPAIEGKDFKLNISLSGEEMKVTGDEIPSGRIDAVFRRFK